MLKIGDIQLKGNVVLAPLAGYTDVGFRRLCVTYGAALTYTEMVSAKGLVYSNRDSKNMLNTAENENPVAVQLFGSQPEFIYKAAQLEELKKFDIIDINMGCPVPKIVGNGEGSALLKDKNLIKEIVSAAIEGGKRPVTVKIRLGFDEGEFNADENAAAIEEAGASAIAVHARTRSRFYSGKADWERLAEVKKAVKIPVIANGDVIDKASFDKILSITDCDGVMIGRGALGQPYIFSEVLGKDFVFDAKASILQHIDDLTKILPDKVVANNMKKHMCYYAKNIAQRKQLKLEVNNAIDLNELKEIVKKYF